MKWVICLLLLFLVIVGGCTKKTIEQQDDGNRTVDDLLAVFEENGIKANITDQSFDVSMKINGVTPVFVEIESMDTVLCIYQYDSYESRREAYKELQTSDIYTKLNEENMYYSSSVNARNMLLFAMTTEVAMNENYSGQLEELLTIIFEEINNGTEHVFVGESEHWLGEIRLRIYEHRLEDEQGNLIDYDKYQGKVGEVTYVGQASESPESVEYNYSFITSNEAGSSSVSDNFFTFGGSTQWPEPRIEGVFEMTIQWGGKEEKLILRPEEMVISK